MDFRLKVFHSVATNLSFTKASKELFISQPAISKHIHELEVQYKTPLFDRVGSHIGLTHAGERWTMCCGGATIWPCCATRRRTRITTTATATVTACTGSR